MTRFVLSAFSDEAGAPLAAQFAALRRNGIRQMELRAVDGESCAELTDNDVREIRRALDGEGVALSALGSPYGKYPVDLPFSPHLDAFRRGLDIASALGCRRIRMFSFFVPKGEAERWKGEVISRLGKMLEFAEREGIRLCHENEKGIYGDTAPRCREILDELPSMGCVFDPANFVQCGQDVPEALQLLQARATYAHVKDALSSDGSVTPAGLGDGRVPDMLKAFARRDEPFTLTLEPHLALFEALHSLQSEPLKQKYAYPSRGAAFDAACQALKRLMEAMGLGEARPGEWA